MHTVGAQQCFSLSCSNDYLSIVGRLTAGEKVKARRYSILWLSKTQRVMVSVANYCLKVFAWQGKVRLLSMKVDTLSRGRIPRCMLGFQGWCKIFSCHHQTSALVMATNEDNKAVFILTIATCEICLAPVVPFSAVAFRWRMGQKDARPLSHKYYLALHAGVLWFPFTAAWNITRLLRWRAVKRAQR